MEPLFPFGHGLSYTTFSFSPTLSIDATSAPPSVAVALNVTNTGAVLGKESVQLYLTFPPAAGEPPRQLRDFEMVQLAPGEAAGVRFVLDARGYSVWDVAAYAWTVVPGEYTVSVGASSRDIRATGSFTVPGQ